MSINDGISKVERLILADELIRIMATKLELQLARKKR